MMSLFRRWLWRIGQHPVPPSRGIAFVGDDAPAPLADFIGLLHESYPRLNLFSVSAAPDARHPPLIPIPGPLDSAGTTRRYLRRLKLQAIVVHGGTDLPEGFFREANALGIKLVCMGSPSPPIDRLARDIALCATTGSAQASALAAGVPASAIVVDADSDALLRRIAPLLVSERAPGKLANTLEDRLIARLEHPLLARFTTRKFEPIESMAALGARLGRPRRILCLGNGPSSEDPALLSIPFDALFRVNHSWLGGPHHTAPDVIFTGKRDTLDAYRRPTIFGFQTEDAARRIMLRSVLLKRRFTYFTAERLGCMNFDFFAPYKPTNGAVMLATAAALATEQLIVAGIDLFSDPRGSYPGDASTPNAYTVAHDRELEARFILETLSAFPGEVIVVGAVLEERWQRHRLESAAAGRRR